MKTFHVKTLYIYKFISQCLPIYAYYTILFINRGMTITDIAVLLAIWSVFTIVFELPSGVLADRWNRRNMLAIASGLQGLCFIIWFFSHTFLMFTFGFVLWAISGTFTSGTEEGLIYDNLKSDSCEGSFANVYGKAQFFANAGIVVGIVSAGIIVNFVTIEIIALISAAICLVNVIIALQIREKNYYSERLSDEFVDFFKTFKEVVVLIKENRRVLVYLLFLVLFANMVDYLDEFDALIISDFQLSNSWVSVILFIRFVFITLGDILAPIVEKRISSIKQIFFLNGMAYIVLAIYTILWNHYALLIFGFAAMIMEITVILLINALQNVIKEEGRSTVMSLYGVGQNVVMFCFSLVYALLTGIFTLQQVYIIISIYGMAGGLSFYLFSKIMSSRI